MKTFLKFFGLLILGLGLFLGLLVGIFFLSPSFQQFLLHRATPAGEFTWEADRLQIRPGGLQIETLLVRGPDQFSLEAREVTLQASLWQALLSRHLRVDNLNVEDLVVRLPARPGREDSKEPLSRQLGQLNDLLQSSADWRWPAAVSVGAGSLTGRLFLPDGTAHSFALEVSGARPESVLDFRAGLRSQLEAGSLDSRLSGQWTIASNRRMLNLETVLAADWQPSDTTLSPLRGEGDLLWSSPAASGGPARLQLVIMAGLEEGKTLGEGRFNLIYGTGRGSGQFELMARFEEGLTSLLPRNGPFARLSGSLEANGLIDLSGGQVKLDGIIASQWIKPGEWDPTLAALEELNLRGQLQVSGAVDDPLLSRLEVDLASESAELFTLRLLEPISQSLFSQTILAAGIPDRDWIALSARRLPLSLFQAFLPAGFTLKSGHLAGNLQVSSDSNAWILRVPGALRAGGLHLTGPDGWELTNGQLELEGSVQWDGVQLKTSGLRLDFQEGSRSLARIESTFSGKPRPPEGIEGTLQTVLSLDLAAIRNRPSLLPARLKDDEWRPLLETLPELRVNVRLNGHTGPDLISLEEGHLQVQPGQTGEPVLLRWNSIQQRGQHLRLNGLSLAAGPFPPRLTDYLRNRFGIGLQQLRVEGNLTHEGDSFSFQTTTPLRLSGLDWTQDGEPMLRGINAATSLDLSKVTPGNTLRWNLADLRLEQGSHTLLSGNLSGSLQANAESLETLSLRAAVEGALSPWAGQPVAAPLRLTPGATYHLQLDLDKAATLSGKANLLLQNLAPPGITHPFRMESDITFGQSQEGIFEVSLPLNWLWQNRRSRVQVELTGRYLGEPDDAGRAVIRINGADLDPLLALGRIWDDEPKPRREERAPLWKETFPIEMRIESGPLFLNQIAYIRSVEADGQFGGGRVGLDRMEAELLSGRLSGNGGLQVDGNPLQPFRMALSLNARDVQLREFARAQRPGQPAQFEGVINFEGSFAGRGGNTETALDNLQGSMSLVGKELRVRILEGPLQNIGALGGAAAGRLLGQVLNRPGIGALTALVPLLSVLSFDEANLQLLRPEDQSLRLQNLTMKGPLLKVQGQGTVEPGALSTQHQRPMLLALDLSSKGDMARHLNTLQLLRLEMDEEEFYPWNRRVHLRGTLSNPDTREVIRLLEQAALGALARP